MVTCVFPYTPKLWKKRVTRSSGCTLPSRTRTMNASSVASGLVSDERSKIVPSCIGAAAARSAASRTRAGRRPARLRAPAGRRRGRRRVRPRRAFPARLVRSSSRLSPPPATRAAVGARRPDGHECRAAASWRRGRARSRGRMRPDSGAPANAARTTSRTVTDLVGAGGATRHLAEDHARQRVELAGLAQLGQHAIDPVRLLVHVFQEQQPTRRLDRIRACRASRPGSTDSRRPATLRRCPAARWCSPPCSNHCVSPLNIRTSAAAPSRFFSRPASIGP